MKGKLQQFEGGHQDHVGQADEQAGLNQGVAAAATFHAPDPHQTRNDKVDEQGKGFIHHQGREGGAETGHPHPGLQPQKHGG